jgi:hypothetical protein
MSQPHRVSSPLLSRLWATVDDKKIFDMSGIADANAFKSECREIFEQLFDTAQACWQRSIDPWTDDDLDVPYPGAALVERYETLRTCWSESFEMAIRTVANQPTLPDAADKNFCYFMLGVLCCGQQENERKLRTRSDLEAAE